MTGPEKEALEVLMPFLGEELAKDIIAHRKGMKAPLTARGARSLIKEYQKTGDTVAAAEMHLNRGWRGFDASWFKKPAQFSDPHNPTPRGDMAAFTRNLMEPRHGSNAAMDDAGNRSTQYALDYPPSSGRH